MIHDPLCLTLEDEGFSVAYFGTAGGSDHIACLSCYLIGKVRGGVTAHVEFGTGNAQGGAGHGLGGGPLRPTLGDKS